MKIHKHHVVIAALIAAALGGLAFYRIRPTPDPTVDIVRHDEELLVGGHLFASSSGLQVVTLNEALKITSDGNTALPCRRAVEAEAMRLNNAGYDPQSKALDLHYFTLQSSHTSFVLLLEERQVFDAETRLPLAPSTHAQGSQLRLLLGFTTAVVETSAAFEECLLDYSEPGHTYKWPQKFIVGGLAVLGLDGRSVGLNGDAKAIRYRVSLNSLSTLYFQYGHGVVDIPAVLSFLKAPKPNPSAAIDEFTRNIHERVIIGYQLHEVKN